LRTSNVRRRVLKSTQSISEVNPMSTGRPIGDPAQQAISKSSARLLPSDFNAPLWLVGLLLLPLVATLIATVLYLKVLPIADERFLVTTVAVFAGALVAGLAGFAFSAVAGAILFHWLPPLDAVPLLLVCSIATQCFGIAKFWRLIQWRHFAPYVLGGVLGIPIGALLLTRMNADVFAVAFGVFLIVYCTYMALRPCLVIARDGRAAEGSDPPPLAARATAGFSPPKRVSAKAEASRGPGAAPIKCSRWLLAALASASRASEIAVGFLGGVTGGATAFPGAIPTMWCNARGLAKDQQRGIIQPYILTMQIATLIYFGKTGLLSSGLWTTFAWCLPAVVLGTLLGFALFNRIDEAKFKRVTLMFLFVSGVLLAL
jgi:uncharacterized membrane protein YfcA